MQTFGDRVVLACTLDRCYQRIIFLLLSSLLWLLHLMLHLFQYLCCCSVPLLFTIITMLSLFLQILLLIEAIPSTRVEDSLFIVLYNANREVRFIFSLSVSSFFPLPAGLLSCTILFRFGAEECRCFSVLHKWSNMLTSCQNMGRGPMLNWYHCSFSDFLAQQCLILPINGARSDFGRKIILIIYLLPWH